MPRNYRYSDSTIRQILGVITQNPGMNGGQIAEKLGLKRSNVNSFLYSWGRREHDLRVRNYRWYLPIHIRSRNDAAHERIAIGEMVSSTPFQETIPTEFEIRAMSRSEIERICRRSDFTLIDDNRLAAIGERKSQIEVEEQRTKSDIKSGNKAFWLLIVTLATLVLAITANN